MGFLWGSSGALIPSGGTQTRERSAEPNGKPIKRMGGDSTENPYVRPVETFSTMTHPREQIVRLFYPNIKTAFGGLKNWPTNPSDGNALLPPMAIPRTTATTRAIRNRDVNKGGASVGYIPGVYIASPK